MTDITVSYKKDGPTGNIVINLQKFPTSDFYMMENTTFKKNDDDDIFGEFQKKLRYLDCVKDASKVKPNVGDAVQVIYDQTFNRPTFTTLNEWENEFIKQNSQLIQKYTWTKKTEFSKLEPILENRVVFKESGLSPEYFIESPLQYVGNIATEIIDPAGRSEIKENDIKFPKNNIKLILEESFLNLFGFENCYIESTRLGNKRYTYKIVINSINQVGGVDTLNAKTTTKGTAKPTAKGTAKTTAKSTTKTTALKTPMKKTAKLPSKIPTKVNTMPQNKSTLQTSTEKIIISSDSTNFVNINNNKPIYWFSGNKEKNTIIKSGQLPTNIKRALFFTKEMGDVLQVLVMFIWSKLNPNDLYSITTCDSVVNLLCMILQINCILTFGEKATAKTKKMRAIEVFEPSSNSPDKSKLRFLNTKNSIIDHNTKFIDCLKTLQASNSLLYASGVNEPILISNEIYAKFIDDLTKINDLLKTQNILDTTSVEDIDKFIKLLKVNFTFVEFIKIYKQTITITMQSIYTAKNKLWIDVINPSVSNYKYGKDTFYKLIKDPSLIIVSPVEIPPPVLEVQPPNILTLTPSEIVDAQLFKFNELITPSSYIATGGSIHKRKRTSPIKHSPSLLESIKYLEYPRVATFYDKNEEEPDHNKTYNLYDELENQIHACLKNIKMDEYFNDVYNLLLHYFYLENKVVYDDELFKLIKNLFAKNKSLKTNISLKPRRIVRTKHVTKKYNSPENSKYHTPPLLLMKENQPIFTQQKRTKYNT